jgi:hypothetical protein
MATACQDAASFSRHSPAYEHARRALPARFIEHETRRYILLSDADPNWTRDQSERLERAHHQFQRFARRMQLEPQPLRHKLICVLFERREDYQRFAAEHDRVTSEWISGYYSPRFDRIVFFNIESDPGVANARRKLEVMQVRAEELSAAVQRADRAGETRQARALENAYARFTRHVHGQRQRIDEFARAVSIATTIHEAVHQLAFHTRVQSPHVHYSLWISEGLATAFETDAPNAAFGPDHDYPVRREAFVNLLTDDALLRLRDLVVIDDLMEAEEGVITAVYHQSYALVTWMSRFRRPELRAYLNLLREQPPGPISAERHLELFRRAFGDIDRIERAWLRHELDWVKDPRRAPAARHVVAAGDVELALTPAVNRPRRGGLIALIADDGR